MSKGQIPYARKNNIKIGMGKRRQSENIGKKTE